MLSLAPVWPVFTFKAQYFCQTYKNCDLQSTTVATSWME